MSQAMTPSQPESLPACLYLHGFLSAPQSGKAQQTLAYYQAADQADRILVPALPFEPEQAIALAIESLNSLQSQYERVIVIGSSLGGFYATHLAEAQGATAVLINPAVAPHKLFRHYIGENRHYYTGEVHLLTSDHLDQLERIAHESIQHPERLKVLLQTGDETLDYRHAERLYRACDCLIEAGGSHTFDDYDTHLPDILSGPRTPTAVSPQFEKPSPKNRTE